MPSTTGGKGSGGFSLAGGFYKTAALVVITVVLVGLLLNSGVEGSKDKVQAKDLDVKVRELQAQLDSLQVEKTKADEGLLQVTLEKEKLKASHAQELAAVSKQAAGVRAEEVEWAAKLKEILSKNWFDPRVLDQARQDYAQWDFLACSYYLGVYVFTTQANVTVPIGCVLYNAAYVNTSKFLIDRISNESTNPVKLALGEIASQYPELEK